MWNWRESSRWKKHSSRVFFFISLTHTRHRSIGWLTGCPNNTHFETSHFDCCCLYFYKRNFLLSIGLKMHSLSLCPYIQRYVCFCVCVSEFYFSCFSKRCLNILGLFLGVICSNQITFVVWKTRRSPCAFSCHRHIFFRSLLLLLFCFAQKPLWHFMCANMH